MFGLNDLAPEVGLVRISILFIYRLTSLPNKSRLKDLAPENEDEQEMPRKVKNIMKSQQQVKRKREKKKMKNRINLGTVKFLNFRTPEIFAVIYLKAKP